MIWSPSHDARISTLSAEGKANQDIAKIVTAEFGTIVSSESVRKRLIRIRENAEMAEALPVVIENEETFVDDQPADGSRIGSSKLVNVQKFFKTADSKTDVDWDTWNLASMGDEKAMDYVVEHCEADVLVLRDVFNHLKPLVRTIHR